KGALMSVWPTIRSLLLPGTVTLGVPAVILAVSGPEAADLPGWVDAASIGAGALLVLLGLVLLAWTIRLFHLIGKGTLANWPPTRHLVLHGPYRHVRNPMMTGVYAILVGETLLLRSGPLLVYVVLFVVTVSTVIRLWEEPSLVRRFGREYEV